MAQGPITSYRDLEVWQVAMDLAVACFQVTKLYPKSELFGLTSQIRRSGNSIAANIAEGHGRETTASFIHFCRIAQGSLKELETHLILSNRVQLITADQVKKLIADCESVGRMVRGMIRSLHVRQ